MLKNIINTVLIGTVLFYSFLGKGYASSINIQFKNVEFPIGFIDRNIKCVVEDKMGLIWFSTINGLYRYNGYSIDLIEYPDGETIFDISVLYIDSENNLWIGHSSGLTMLNLLTWHFTDYDFSDLSPRRNNGSRVTALTFDENRVLYVALSSNEIFTIKDGKVSRCIDLMDQTMEGERYGSIKLMEFVNGELFVTTHNVGLVFFIHINDGIGTVSRRFVNETLRGSPLSDVIFAADGDCLIDIGKEYLLYLENDFSSIREIPMGHGNTSGSLMKLDGERVAVICPNGTVFSFDFGSGVLTKESQSYAVPLKGRIMINAKTHSWQKVTLFENGSDKSIVKIVEGSSMFNTHLLNFTQANSIRGIYRDKQYGTFLGSYSEGFIWIDNSQNVKKVIHPTIYPYSIISWNKDTVLVGAEGLGLFLFDMKHEVLKSIIDKFKLNSRRLVTTILKIDNEHVLAGCYEGMFIINIYTQEKTALNLPEAERFAHYPVAYMKIIKDRLWVCSDIGLFCFSVNKNAGPEHFVGELLYTSNDSRAYTGVVSVDDKIYASTRGAGIIVLADRSYKIVDTISRKKYNIHNDIVYSVAVHDHVLAAGTNLGLSVIDLINDSIKNYTVYNGLPHVEFNTASVLNDGNKLLMGTMNGLVEFDADSIRHKDVRQKKMLLTAMILRRKSGRPVMNYTTPYSPQQELVVESGVVSFTLQFGFNEILENKYLESTYYRVNENEPWTLLPLVREISFASMSPGNYVIQIATLKADGSVKEMLYENKLTVKPSFFQTNYFMFLLVLTGVCLSWAMFKIRERQKQKEKNIRLNLAEDLHDEVGGLLTGLTLQADYLQYVEEGRKGEYVAKISRTGREAVMSMQDIVWGMYDQADNTNALLMRMRDFIQVMDESSDATFNLDIRDEEHIQLNAEERRNLWMIFKEAVNNAIKHAEARNIYVLFQAMNSKHGWHLEIKDDGKGFDTTLVMKGNGLRNMRIRSERIKATFHVDNSTEGTILKIYKK